MPNEIVLLSKNKIVEVSSKKFTKEMVVESSDKITIFQSEIKNRNPKIILKNI